MLRTINIPPLGGERITPVPTNTFYRACRLLPSAYCLLFAVFFFLLTVHCSLLTAKASWVRQPAGTMAWLHAVYFLDQNRGWVTGSGGTLLETIDGGQTWRRLLQLTKDNLRDVYFADEKTGWLVAERDALKLKTNDEPQRDRKSVV